MFRKRARQAPEKRGPESDRPDARRDGGAVEVPLAQVARLEHDFEPGVIWRRNRIPTVTVRATLYDGTQPAVVVGQLAADTGRIRADLPLGYRLDVGGAVEESAKGSTSVGAGMPVFILTVLTVLMLQLKSFSRTIMVVLTAPLGMIGVTAFGLVFTPTFYVACRALADRMSRAPGRGAELQPAE